MNTHAIDNVRILAVFAVVLLHTAAATVIASPPGSLSFWISNAYDSLTRWCVPVLVMLSGYLLLQGAKTTEPADVFYRKRLNRLLVPIVVWTVLYLFWIALKSTQRGSPQGLPFYFEKIFTGRPYYHMWYLYMIIPLYLLTPLLRKHFAPLAMRVQTPLILVLLVAAAIWQVLPAFEHPVLGFFGFMFLPYLGYFMAGPIASGWLRTMDTKLLVLAYIAISTVVASGYFYSPYFYKYLSVPVIFMSLVLFALLSRVDRPIFGETRNRAVADATLGVYLLHPFVLEVVRKSVFVPENILPALSIPALAVAIFAFCLAVTLSLRQFALGRAIC